MQSITQTKEAKQQLLINNGADQLNLTFYPKPYAATVILLHGGPGVPYPMEPVANWLHDHFQVIYFQQRGTGASKCASNDYSLAAYVSDINCIAAHYNLEQFHLFGHSWGGLYAQIYAQQHPDRILSLFLCSPSSGTNHLWKTTEKEVMAFNQKQCSTANWLKMGWHSLKGQLGDDVAFRKVFYQVYQNYHKGFGDFEINLEELNDIYATPIIQTRKSIIKYPALLAMPNPNFPIMLTYGDKDIYGESKASLIHRLPTANQSVLANCGHLPWMHQPIAFEKVLEEFYNLLK